MPDWSPGKIVQVPILKRVAEMLPMEGKTVTQRKKKEKELVKVWEEKAPHSLSFVKKVAATGKPPLIQDKKNALGTRNPSESHDLSSGPSFSIDGLPESISLVMSSITGKPISLGPMGKDFGLNLFGRQLKVTLGLEIEDNDQSKAKSKKGKQGGGEGTSAGAAGPSSSARRVGTTLLWAETFTPSDQHWAFFAVTGFTDKILSQGAGLYSLEFQLQNDFYVNSHQKLLPLGNEKLAYQFSVSTKPPSAATAHFLIDEDEEADVDPMETDEPRQVTRKRHKAGLSISENNKRVSLVIQLVDSTGSPAAFPSSFTVSNATERIRISMSIEDVAATKTRKAPLIKQVLDRESLSFELSDDRMSIKVTNLKTEKLKIPNGYSVDAAVDIVVSVSGHDLCLPSPLSLVLRAGRPTTIATTKALSESIVKGEYICRDTRIHLRFV